MTKQFSLNSKTRFVNAVVDLLAEKYHSLPSGAKSLEHILVIVPTAQSSRRLRRILAERAGPIVAPRVMMPAGLVMPENRDALANRTDELLAFTEALGDENALEEAAQYVELRSALGANALLFKDVASKINELLKYNPELASFEEERWQNLANLEEKYLKALARRNKTDRSVAMQEVLNAPIVLKGIEKIIVAGVLQPIPVMEKALCQTGLSVEYWEPETSDLENLPLSRLQITPAGTVMNEAAKIAEIVSSVKNDKEKQEAWPSICLADSDMFPELQAALKAKELTIHNPACTSLTSSSLGQLVVQLCTFARGDDFDVFSSLLRGGDVRRWLKTSLALNDAAYAQVLIELDELQAKILPEKVADIRPFMSDALRQLTEYVSHALKQKQIQETLSEIFSTLKLSEKDLESREFISAARVMNDLLLECFDESVPQKLQLPLFMRRLEESSYSLEPDDGDSLLLDGWLELPFLETEELIIAGFQEGCVPESIVGHAFLPDSLRAGLGLPTNESRVERDARILAMVLKSRPENAVRIFFHSVAANGDVVKPSRLLFRCANDVELAKRVEMFYSRGVGTESALTPELPEEWKLKLPIPPQNQVVEQLTLTELDSYVKCPFTYYLKQILGEPAEYKEEEISAMDFGTLLHDALQRWASSELKDSEDPDEISRVLKEHIDKLLQNRFGANIPAIVFLQSESMKARLESFANRQVEWHKEGWRIHEVEKSLSVKYDGTTLRGRLDRIDYNEETKKWCVIDYKAWKSDKSATIKSFQLPAYVAMWEVACLSDKKPVAREDISACYCVLGQTADDVVFTEPFKGELLSDKENEIRKALDKLRRGIFWPCVKNKSTATFEWANSFAHLMIEGNVEKSLDASWIKDQEERVQA